MTLKIGFIAEEADVTHTETADIAEKRDSAPRKSVVQVHFAQRNMTLTYYNDQFDLHQGDIVYVDGKMENLRGCVTSVNYNFKIKISDYKRVIAVADTDIHGEFFMAGSHFVSFNPAVIPFDKVRTWFKAPEKDDTEFASGSDDTAFSLDNLKEMKIDTSVAQRGYDYYIDNKVKYLSMNGTRGYAIVEGTRPYEVEFKYCDGEISELTCACFCGYNCKHEFAALLQLKETLELIEKNYQKQYAESHCFAAVEKGMFFAVAIDGKKIGSFTI